MKCLFMCVSQNAVHCLLHIYILLIYLCVFSVRLLHELRLPGANLLVFLFFFDMLIDKC